MLSGCPDRVFPAEPQTSPSVAAAVIVAIRVAPAHAFPDAHPVVVAICIVPAHAFPDAHLVAAICAADARWTPVSPLPQQWLHLLLSLCSDFPLSVALLQVLNPVTLNVHSIHYRQTTLAENAYQVYQHQVNNTPVNLPCLHSTRQHVDCLIVSLVTTLLVVSI